MSIPSKTLTVAYDLSAAEVEGQLRDKLIALGWAPPGAHPSRGVVDEATWHCTNCRTRFTATDADWKRGFGRCAPACPSCKAFSQFTYPLGAAGLVDKIERMGFSCEGGPLANCTDWHKAKHALQAAALPAVPDGMVLVPREPTEEMMSAWFNHGATDGRVIRLDNSLREAARADWSAMLAATPAHDQPEGSDNG